MPENMSELNEAVRKTWDEYLTARARGDAYWDLLREISSHRKFDDAAALVRIHLAQEERASKDALDRNQVAFDAYLAALRG